MNGMMTSLACTHRIKYTERNVPAEDPHSRRRTTSEKGSMSSSPLLMTRMFRALEIGFGSYSYNNGLTKWEPAGITPIPSRKEVDYSYLYGCSYRVGEIGIPVLRKLY